MKTTTETPKQRLEYLRGELRAERISYGELSELQSLRAHIDPSDVELLEAAGVPEFPETAGHTPGKWTANSDGQIQCEKVNQYGNFIVAAIQRELTDEDRANARLIASAPDLLSACQSMVDAWGSCECTKGHKSEGVPCPWCEARAAIAKATGEGA